MFCDRFLLKIHYLMSPEYLQIISCSLFISVRPAESHKFNDAFDSFSSKSASCDIIC